MAVATQIPEFPVALVISPLVWAVSDGVGRIYVVQISADSPTWVGRVDATYEYVGETGGALVPFRMHSVDLLTSGKVMALLSTTAKVAAVSNQLSSSSGGLSASTRLKIPSTTVFDFLAVFMSAVPQVEASPLEPIWTLRSHDLPNYVHFDAATSRYSIGAPTTMYRLGHEVLPAGRPPRPVAEQEDDEDEPMPPRPSSNDAPKPPPYSWTQDGESITLVFAIPSDTPTSSIRTTFSRQFLTLHIGSASAALSSSYASDLPHVSHKKLWDVIDPHTSVWTFDRDAEGRDSTFGLLSLHLEKGNPGTRWSDIFAVSPPEEFGVPSLGASDRKLEGVPETMDPSELANISESMEQWTQGVAGGVGADNEGMGQGVPTSLIGEEIDVEVDGDSGRPFVVTWIEGADQPEPKLVRPHPTIPYSLLSVPLPLANSPPSVVIKHDVDGLLFGSPAPEVYTWHHTSTFPALAFVLASKRDAHFVYHLSNRVVFAFDSPSQFSTSNGPRSGAGNLFAYFNTEGKKDTTGQQYVLRIGGPTSGSLVGVGGIAHGGGTSVLALCEKELVVFRLL